MGGGGHNVPIIHDGARIRRLNPKECFNLQGFPSDFILPKIGRGQLYKQAGNSVVIPVIEQIARNIIISLDK
jgi:DNA (cytosine-5)-methyltransferase 1